MLAAGLRFAGTAKGSLKMTALSVCFTASCSLPVVHCQLFDGGLNSMCRRLTPAAAASCNCHVHPGVRHRPAGAGPELAHAGAVPAERPAVLQR
jgi:hypothetical protein